MAARSLRNLIIDLHRQGITIFLTTHYLEEADLLCDRIAVLVKGRIVAVGTPERLKSIAEEESIIEFTFDRMNAKFVEELSERLPQLKTVLFNQNSMRIYGGAPTHILETVLQYARNRGTEIIAVKSVKPSLEDAFVKITV